MSSLSGLVIAFNEERHIAECIRSLKKVCDDVVVVDSGSTDATRELAEAEGARVIIQAPFLGDGPQRSIGIPHCQHAWIVNLDADERLEPDLIAYLQSTDLDQQDFDALETRRRNYIGQRTTRFGGQYPDYVCRIFHRERAHFPAVLAHTRLQAKRIKQLPLHITHYSYRDYGQLIGRACQYPVKMGEALAQSTKPVHVWQPFVHGTMAFIKHYIVKLGFLAGLDGLTLSIGKGLGAYLKYARAIEVRREQALNKK